MPLLIGSNNELDKNQLTYRGGTDSQMFCDGGGGTQDAPSGVWCVNVVGGKNLTYRP